MACTATVSPWAAAQPTAAATSAAHVAPTTTAGWCCTATFQQATSAARPSSPPPRRRGRPGRARDRAARRRRPASAAWGSAAGGRGRPRRRRRGWGGGGEAHRGGFLVTGPRPCAAVVDGTWSPCRAALVRPACAALVPGSGPPAEESPCRRPCGSRPPRILRCVRFRILGPLQVTGDGDRAVDAGRREAQGAAHPAAREPGRVIGIDRIVDTLWGDDPPPTVTGTLQSYVSQLRRVLEPDRGPRRRPRSCSPARRATRCRWLPTTWTCWVRPPRRGRRPGGDRGRPGARGGLLGAAMELWRGEPLAELADAPGTATERLRMSSCTCGPRSGAATPCSRWAVRRPRSPTCSGWSPTTRCASGCGPGW